MKEVRVGQRWLVGLSIYRIVSLEGPDPCYPIVMECEYKDPRTLDGCREVAMVAFSGDLEAVDRHLEKLRHMGMHQELKWFDRSDVREIKAIDDETLIALLPLK